MGVGVGEGTENSCHVCVYQSFEMLCTLGLGLILTMYIVHTYQTMTKVLEGLGVSLSLSPIPDKNLWPYYKSPVGEWGTRMFM